jgi:hypothetical protein
MNFFKVISVLVGSCELFMPIPDYEAAYVTGEVDGNEISFELNLDIEDVEIWAADPNHRAVATGFVE